MPTRTNGSAAKREFHQEGGGKVPEVKDVRRPRSLAVLDRESNTLSDCLDLIKAVGQDCLEKTIPDRKAKVMSSLVASNIRIHGIVLRYGGQFDAGLIPRVAGPETAKLERVKQLKEELAALEGVA